MLLRDSKIAQEVRTQLLNIVEHTAEEKPELLTQDIDDEEKLQAAIGKAFATGDIMEFATAAQAYTAFQRRHIDRIETSNKLLTAEVLHISDRKMFNRVMRKFASTLHISFGVAFSMLYKQLSYRYGIDLKSVAIARHRIFNTSKMTNGTRYKKSSLQFLRNMVST